MIQLIVITPLLRSAGIPFGVIWCSFATAFVDRLHFIECHREEVKKAKCYCHDQCDRAHALKGTEAARALEHLIVLVVSRQWLSLTFLYDNFTVGVLDIINAMT